MFGFNYNDVVNFEDFVKNECCKVCGISRTNHRIGNQFVRSGSIMEKSCKSFTNISHH